MRNFFGGARSGFFVEVGANRPQELSQTWHLEQLGWTGILVEPQPELAGDLCRARSAKVFAVACSSPENAGRRMQLHVAGPWSALDRDRMTPGAQPERVIEVPVRTLDDILIEATSSRCSAGLILRDGGRVWCCSKISSEISVSTDFCGPPAIGWSADSTTTAGTFRPMRRSACHRASAG